MIENIKKISNPLTIIAIFAGLAETAGTIGLVNVDKEVQAIFVWFVMLFPAILVALFFLTLNFNHQVLYSPDDYKSDEAFLKAMKRKEDLQLNISNVETELNKLSNTFQKSLNEKIDGANQEQVDNLKYIIEKEIASVRNKVEVAKESAEELSLLEIPNSKLQATILGFIYMKNKPITLSELSKSIPMSEGAIERATTKMVKRGAIDAIEYEGKQCFVRSNL